MPASSAGQGVKSVLRGRFLVTLPIPRITPSLSSQLMIVTGANSGLGYESCVHLMRLGLAKLIMAVRTVSKGEEAKAMIVKTTRCPASSIEVWQLDMNDYSSVKAFAKRASDLPRIDGVLASAGIMITKYELSQGSESMLNVNFISPFLLYSLLVEAMRRSHRKTGTPCRFTIPNSALHHMAPLAELHDSSESIIGRLNDPKRADMKGRYSVTKLLVLFMVREIARQSDACILNTPNPSFCKSKLAQENSGSFAFKIAESVFARSTEEGSRTLIHGLLADKSTHGKYLSDCKVER